MTWTQYAINEFISTVGASPTLKSALLAALGVSGGGGSAPNKPYVAVLNFDPAGGDENPTVAYELGPYAGQVTWTRVGEGQFRATGTNVFGQPHSRVYAHMAIAQYGDEAFADARIVSPDTAEVTVRDIAGNLIDGFSNLIFEVDE